MIRKRVVRVLVYDGPVEWVNRTMERNYVKGAVIPLECPGGGHLIQETIINTLVYDDELVLPEGE